MYSLSGNSPFRMCGKDDIRMLGFLETYLVLRTELSSDDYEALTEAIKKCGKIPENERNADRFLSLFEGKEVIRKLLSDLCKGKRYGFFEDMAVVDERPDMIYQAMFSYLGKGK